ncbi:hypothetical protein BJV82DRAFT_672329 [Fennellomyces sp. T-0311]|nr:hypothetical protein BJV82DRAFT_672329 [Fennellomyces sp. T-0311]
MLPEQPSSPEPPPTSQRSANSIAPWQQQIEPTTTRRMIDLEIAVIKNALQAGQYNVVIAHSSLAIPMAFERKAQTALELKHALLLTRARPKSALGYLRAAKLYKLQGKQEEAIDVLKAGCSLIEGQRTLLLQQMVSTNAQLQRRIDFQNLTKQTVALSCGYLPIIAQYIEQITVDGKARLMAKYLKFLTQYDFPRLYACHTNDDCESMYGLMANDHVTNFASARKGSDISNTLYTVLPYIAQTLTELHIRMRFTLTISLDRILSICRNLTAVSLLVRQISEAYQSFSMSPTTALISVALLAQDGVHDPPYFETLFRYSPHLRSFSLHYCDADIIRVVADHCTNLKAIRTSLVNLDDVPQYYILTAQQIDIKGLELLVLGGIRSAVPLSAHLQASRCTLKYICLAPIGGPQSTATEWQPLTQFVMLKVIYLYVWMERCPKTFREQIPAMLRCYPGLKTLRLESWNSIVSERSPAPVLSQIYQTMVGTEGLERLGLARADVGLDSFFKLILHYSTRDSSLRELEIRSCTGLTPVLLLQIAKISSLEDLCVGLLPVHEIDSSAMNDFTQLLIQLARLSTLIFEDSELTTEATENSSSAVV